MSSPEKTKNRALVIAGETQNTRNGEEDRVGGFGGFDEEENRLLVRTFIVRGQRGINVERKKAMRGLWWGLRNPSKKGNERGRIGCRIDRGFKCPQEIRD